MIILQGNPQGMPNVLTPSLDIQDIDRMKNDIPKWKNWITEKSLIEWEDFLQNQVPQIQEPPVQPNKWNLDIMKVVARREATEAGTVPSACNLIFQLVFNTLKTPLTRVCKSFPNAFPTRFRSRV